MRRVILAVTALFLWNVAAAQQSGPTQEALSPDGRMEFFRSEITPQAPGFSGHDVLTNEPVSLEALRGRFVLLDFWFINCGECQRSLPEVRSISNRYDLSVVAIDPISRDSAAEIAEYVTARRAAGLMRYPVIDDEDNRIAGPYRATARFPTIVLIDPGGRIVSYATGFNLAQMREELNRAGVPLRQPRVERR